MADSARPLRIVHAAAPIRICDNGGWTDTWFAKHGRVFHIAVHPLAEVQVVVRRAEGRGRVFLSAENFADRYEVPSRPAPPWTRHPLLEAAIAYMQVPEDVELEVTIYSQAPAGASTGTSAAVTVALIGALDRLTPGQLSPHEVALAAQRVETELLGQQCGVQDQICAAYGGINYVEMFDYPHASVSPVHVPDATRWELERRLLLVFLGRTHDSSAVHEQVIASLEGAGPDCPQLAALRDTAPRSRDALCAGDFAALGRAMSDNTEAQARLHPALVGSEAAKVIAIAREHGVLGWKVNGAGGEGGSLTLLCDGDASRKRALVRAIESADPLFRHIPVHLSRHGLRVWTTD